MDYGWTLEYALQLPARQFFAMAKASREIYSDRMNNFYLEMTDIVPAATGVAEYHRDLKQVYFDRVNKDRKLPTTAFDISNKDQGMIAAAKLARVMKGMARG